jgi:hypothetical protein
MAKKDIHSDKELIAVLSAYLDGELGPGQAQKIERRLAEDPRMRQLLNELGQVSQMVHELGRTKAPDGLADEVTKRLERDLLLDRSDVLAELAGEKHLRLRRFATAAAMVMLIGAIGTIIYHVLSKPYIPRPERVTDKFVAVAPEEPRTVKTLKMTVADDAAEKVTVPVETAVDKEIESIIDKISEIKYSNLRLVVAGSDILTETGRLEKLFADQNIGKVIRTQINENYYQYAFVCPTDQFQRIFSGLRHKDNQIDLVVSDDQGQCVVVVPRATQQQAMKLAGEANPTVQLTHAMQFAMADNNTVLGRNDIHAEWLQWIAKEQPSLDDLRVLGGPSEGVNEEKIGKIYKPAVSEALMASTEEEPAQSQPAQLVAVVVVVQSAEKPDEDSSPSQDTGRSSIKSNFDTPSIGDDTGANLDPNTPNSNF